MTWLSQHWVAISAILSYVGLAFFNALPNKLPIDWYDVFYKTVTSLANRHRNP